MKTERSRSSLRWWLGGPLATAVATGIGLAAGMNATAVAGIFVLAVVAAALLAGLGGGLVASASSFVSLNYFFTPPRGTFEVEKTEDLVALFVFLVVSLVVSGLLSSLLTERLRAEGRELQLEHLYGLAQSLIAGAAPEVTLKEMAESLVEVFGFARAEVRVPEEGAEMVAAVAGKGGRHPPAVVPIGRGLGSVAVYLKDPGVLAGETASLVEAFVSQAALALERARLDGEARRARLESEASEIRAALFSAVTHDLKTPLSTIKAAITSLLDANARLGPEDVANLLEMILLETNRLNRLLGNLLDLARIQAGALEPRTVAADVAEILGAVLERLRPVLAGRPLDVAIAEGLPEVAADVIQLDQVLSNLLENAARFSSEGSPIRVSANREGGYIELRVSDRGAGIPPEERERVFEPFYHKDRGQTRGGSGLGLAIARAIVVAHGGRIWIEPTPGGGTTLALSLPVTQEP
ncbi:MAG: ATP-binding protein [Actinomycetota bacterium]